MHLLHERLPYDPATDLVPIAPVIDNFLGVSATALLKVNSLAELVQAARAQPGKLNWAATPGLPYYVLLALQKSAGIDMVQVSYRDFAPAYQDLNQGRLHVAATGVPTLAPHHQAGTAKLLFVTNRDRSPQTPDVPTAAEAGYARAHIRRHRRSLWLARHARKSQGARSRPTSLPSPPTRHFARARSRSERRRAAARRPRLPRRSKSSAPRSQRSIRRAESRRHSERCACRESD